jgi:hypothetical protein
MRCYFEGRAEFVLLLQPRHQWGPRELYVSQRASLTELWGTPQVLPNVNSPSDESCPALSLDEHRLYFVSDRFGGCGGPDFYVSRRHDRKDDFGWESPVNLGCISDGYVNSPGYEQTPSFFEDETGTEVMYFTRGMDVPYDFDIYESRMRNDETFGPGTIVQELSNPYPYADLGPAVRRDGLEIIFASTRPGGRGGFDLWTATRESTEDAWSESANLWNLNSPVNEIGRLCFTFDGRGFYFASNRSGGYGGTDIYVTTREKVRGPK